MKLLLISRDPSVILNDNSFEKTEVIKRHEQYGKKLKELAGNKSEIRIVGYSPVKTSERQYDFDLKVYSTNSERRFNFIKDINKVFSQMNWEPDLISPQMPWEEGSWANFIRIKKGIKTYIQLHFELNSIFWLKESWQNRFKKNAGLWALKGASRIRVVNSGLKKYLVSSGFSERAIDIIPVGVNVPDINDSKFDIRRNYFPENWKDSRIVLFAGRLEKSKGLDVWVKVASKVIKNIQNIKFLWLGNGSQKESLKLLIEHHNLSDHFILKTGIMSPEIFKYYKASDIFLLTSNNESFGRVIVESQKLKLPVLSTNTGGGKYLVEDGHTGALEEINDVEGIANRLISLLKNPQLRDQISANAFDYVNGKYDLEGQSIDLVKSWLKAFGGT